MARHTFNFEHGGILTTMGATWFVSRAYFEYVDKNHKNWQYVKTHNNRNSVFANNSHLHSYFLQQVDTMDENNLNKNTIGLDGNLVKQMANEILISFL